MCFFTHLCRFISYSMVGSFSLVTPDTTALSTREPFGMVVAGISSRKASPGGICLSTSPPSWAGPPLAPCHPEEMKMPPSMPRHPTAGGHGGPTGYFWGFPPPWQRFRRGLVGQEWHPVAGSSITLIFPSASPGGGRGGTTVANTRKRGFPSPGFCSEGAHIRRGCGIARDKLKFCLASLRSGRGGSRKEPMSDSTPTPDPDVWQKPCNPLP